MVETVNVYHPHYLLMVGDQIWRTWMFSFFHLSLRGLRGNWYECEDARGRPIQRWSVWRSPSPTANGLLMLKALNRAEGRSCYPQFEGLGNVKYIFNLNITQHIKLCVLKYTFLVGTRLGNSLYAGRCLTHPFSIWHRKKKSENWL